MRIITGFHGGRPTLLLAAFAALLACASTGAQDPVNDWTIVPGHRVGPITATTTEDDLVRWFGRDQVERSEIHLGEGEFVPGVVVFPGGPNELELVWKSPTTRRCPGFVTIRGPDSRWVTERGIRVGTTLEELEELNGRPFTFSGFGYDGAGTIRSWEGGALEEDHALGSGIRARLGYPYDPENPRITNEEFFTIEGDRSLSSRNPVARRLGLRVTVLEAFWGVPYRWTDAEEAGECGGP